MSISFSIRCASGHGHGRVTRISPVPTYLPIPYTLLTPRGVRRVLVELPAPDNIRIRPWRPMSWGSSLTRRCDPYTSCIRSNFGTKFTVQCPSTSSSRLFYCCGLSALCRQRCVCVHNYYRLTRFWVSGLVVLVVPPGHTRLAHAPVLDPSCCCNRLRLSQNQVLWLMV